MPPIRATGRPGPRPRPTGQRPRTPPAAARPAPRPRRVVSRAEQRQRRIALALAGLLAASLVAILFILYQVFLATSSPPTLPLPREPSIPSNARRFASLSEFERSRLVPGIPFAVTITEPELNARLQTELAKQGDALPFRDVRATVLDDRIDFNGQVRAAGAELPSTVSIRFFARGGGLGYELQSISFGPIPVPGIARQAVTDAIDRQLASQKLSDQWLLDDVQARVGAVTLVGHPK
jgi:hypothetical protein